MIPDVFFRTFGCWEHPCIGRARATSFSRDACGITAFFLDLRRAGEISSIQKYTQRAKPFTCPSSSCVLSRAHSRAQLCSWSGHKGLSPYIAYKTIFFLVHNYFQGPVSPTAEDWSGRHADPKGPSWLSLLTGQGREFLLVILMSGLIPPPAVPCLFGTQHPALLHSCWIFSNSRAEVRPLHDAGGKRAEVGRWVYSSKTPQILQSRGWLEMEIVGLASWMSSVPGEALRRQRGSALGNPKLRSQRAFLLLTAGTSLSFPILRITPRLCLPPGACF